MQKLNVTAKLEHSMLNSKSNAKKVSNFREKNFFTAKLL